MLTIEKEDMENLISDILDEVAIEIFKESQENLVEFKAVDTGFLMRSGFIDLSKKTEKIIGYSASYAMYVEFGRGSGKRPPIEEIKKWVKRKLRKQGKEADRLAWAIANKIAEEGIKPRPFLRKAIHKVKSKLKEFEVILE